MGYTTLRNIHIDTGAHSPYEIALAFIEKFDAYEIGVYTYIPSANTTQCTLDFDGLFPRKWYGEIEDMKEFSRRFPSAEFCINGQGEDVNDTWEHQYKNGVVKIRNKEVYFGDWQDA